MEESSTLTDYANRICVSHYHYYIRNTRSIVLEFSLFDELYVIKTNDPVELLVQWSNKVHFYNNDRMEGRRVDSGRK